MPDNPDSPRALPYGYSPHGPFIYFENVLSFGHLPGIITVTGAACDRIGPEGTLVHEHAVVAYLRCNTPAAVALRDALDKALLLASPPAGEGKAN
jgi:hypothetical protein